MKIITFEESNITFAANQPEYLPMPAYQENDDISGRITCCWQLSWREVLKLLLTRKIWHSVLTFQQPLQPQLLTVEKPEMKKGLVVAPDII